MESLSFLRQFEQSSPVEVVRTLDLVKADKATGRPAFRMMIALADQAELNALDRKHAMRVLDTDDGREQMRQYRRGIGVLACRGWSGCVRDNIEIVSRWAMMRPGAMSALPTTTNESGETVQAEVPFDAAGRDFLMEILDDEQINFISNACVNTEAFALEQHREKKK